MKIFKNFEGFTVENNQKTQKTLAICIPCWNEETTIGAVVRNFKAALPNATIYVYDNNSTDQSVALAQEAGAIVRFETRQGKGNVVRTMFREIEAEIYLLVDADGQQEAKDAQRLIEAVANGSADMAIGDRLSSSYFETQPRAFHNAGNRLVRFLVNRLFHSNIHDMMTGYRAFSRDFVKNFPALSPGFEIETEMTIHAVDHHFKIVEMPVIFHNRPNGNASKLSTFRDGFKVLKTIAVLFKNYKPMAFFSILAGLTALLALILGVPVLEEYFLTGLAPRLPRLIAAGVLVMMSLLLLSVGVILDVILHLHHQDFEMWLRRNRKP